MTRRCVLALAVVALVATGAAAAGPEDPKKVILPAVQAKARTINVRLSDLPGSGWKAKPASPDDSSPRCSYYQPDQSDLTENGSADSPEFTLASGSFVSSTTGIFKNASQGRTAYARVVQPELPRCLAQIFRKGTGKPNSVTILSAAAAKFPQLAERTNAYRIVADFRTAPTKTVRVFIDLVLLNRGKVDVALFFAGIGGAFSHSFKRSVAAKVAARMAVA